jgi:hypothetical protein
VTVSWVVLFAAIFSASDLKADTVEKRANGYGGKLDRWITRDPQGGVIMIATDGNHHDGLQHHWIYYKDGSPYKREWDRNFDGKADLRVFEDRGRYVSEERDDNFNGKFEVTEKALPRGSSGKIRTMNGQNPFDYL